MSEARTSDRRIKTAERRNYVLKLRKEGNTYREIATKVHTKFPEDVLPKGYDCRYAYQDVKAELEKVQDSLWENAKHVRVLELERLDKMMLGIWPRAEDGDDSAIDRVLRIMKRRADILGLDAPGKHLVHELDLGSLTDQQLARIADGEDPLDVLIATAGQS